MLSEKVKTAGFLAKTMEGYGKHAVKSQRKQIARRTKKRTGNLRRTPRVSTVLNGGDSGTMVFSLADYQRFQDMRLSSRVYNKVFTWYYHSIAQRLMYGYVSETAQLLQDKLQDDGR